MKRSLFSLLLVLVLLVTVSTFAAEAATYEEVTAEMTEVTGNLEFYCPYCKGTATFIQWDGENYGGDGAEHRYVPADLTMGQDVNVRKLHLYIAAGATVDTNGYTLKMYNTETDATNSELAIMGSGTLKTTSAVAPITYTSMTSQVYLLNATIDVSDATTRAAELLYAANTLDIRSGKIIGVKASPSTSYEGGSVKVTSGKLTMSDGTITGGHAKNGGNVYINKGTFTMTGGTIEHGNTTYHGGNVYVVGTSSAKASFTMSGSAQIEAGVAAKNGGNINVQQYTTFTMNGGTVTTNDSDGTNNGSANNAPNIAVSHSSVNSSSYITTVDLNGGTISGGAGKNGGAVWFYTSSLSSTSRAQVKLGGVAIHDPDVTRTSDIYTTLYGRVTVKSTFKDRVLITMASGSATNTTAQSYPIANRSVLIHDGSYVDAGVVTLRRSSTDYNLVGDSSDNMAVSNAAIFDGAQVVTPYASVADAVAATLADGQYVKLYQDGASLDLTQNTYVDFNGHNATVTGGEYLLGMDSKTNSYVDNGAAKVTVTGDFARNTAIDVSTGTRKYLALENGDGTYSFHRYYLSMDEVGLRAYASDESLNPGLLYGAVFYGDEAVAEAINNNGEWGIIFKAGDNEEVPVNFGTSFVAGKNTGKKVCITGYMDSEENANTNILGWAYIKIGNETIKCSDVATRTMKSVIGHAYDLYNNKFAALNTAQVAAIEDIHGTYGESIKTWWGFEMAAQA